MDLSAFVHAERGAGAIDLHGRHGFQRLDFIPVVGERLQTWRVRLGAGRVEPADLSTAHRQGLLVFEHIRLIGDVRADCRRIPESEFIQTHDETLRIHSAQFHGAQHMAGDFHGTDDHGLLTASLERLVTRVIGGQKTIRLEIGDPVPRLQMHVLADDHTPPQYAGDFDAIGPFDGLDVGDFLLLMLRLPCCIVRVRW